MVTELRLTEAMSFTVEFGMIAGRLGSWTTPDIP